MPVSVGIHADYLLFYRLGNLRVSAYVLRTKPERLYFCRMMKLCVQQEAVKPSGALKSNSRQLGCNMFIAVLLCGCQMFWKGFEKEMLFAVINVILYICYLHTFKHIAVVFGPEQNRAIFHTFFYYCTHLFPKDAGMADFLFFLSTFVLKTTLLSL